MNYLGDYALIKPLGIGSFGEVIVGEHRFLKKKFALKILPDEVAQDKHFLSRFEKEISALSLLDHPGIVKLHNVSSSDEKYFLVTDCILTEKGDALNLAQYVSQKGGRLSEDEIVAIVTQAASALDYAHTNHQMAHRGIKLSNILITKTEGFPAIHLTDFGLSRIVGIPLTLSRLYKALSLRAGHDPTKIDQAQQSFLQSFHFLSPELRRGDTSFDVQADTYAFGVLVYYLLTSRFPEGYFELPSHVSPQYRLQWDKLVKACLQYLPSQRPTKLCQALEELLPRTVAPESEAVLKPSLKPQEFVKPEIDLDPGAIFQTEMTVGKYQPKEAEIKEVVPIQTDMVVIKGGDFFRGSNNGGRDEMPRHRVQLSSFAVDIHPVTNEQFVCFLEVMGGEKDHQNNDLIRLRDSRVKKSAGRLVIESGYAKHPVVGITWYGAIGYAKWVGKRLPTEAEWEAACFGGLEEAIYPTGHNIERAQANFFSSDTTAVMSYPANGYGLYDMAGNVYEWCQDWYGYHYYDTSVQEPTNPQGPLQGVYRVLRGGCWKSLKDDMRCAHRHRNNPGAMNGTYGFRCASDVA